MRVWPLVIASLVVACGRDAVGPAARAESRASAVAQAAAPILRPLPPRGQAVLHYADDKLTIDAFAAPRRPLLERLAHDAAFLLDADASDWPPLTLRLDDTPLELALPLVVGDLEYDAKWTTVDGVHRLTKLSVGAVRADVASGHAPDGRAGDVSTRLPGGEVGQSLEVALAELHADDVPKVDAETARKNLGDPDPEVRVRAVLALEPAGDDLKAVVQLLKSDPDPRVRAATTAVLEDSNDFAAVRALVDALADPDPEVVTEAIDSLQYVGDRTVAADLEPLLAHEDARVREHAADAIEFLVR